MMTILLKMTLLSAYESRLQCGMWMTIKRMLMMKDGPKPMSPPTGNLYQISIQFIWMMTYGDMDDC